MSDKPVILIVDDDPINLQIMANTLKETYQLKIAIHGSQAIQLAQKQPFPDLILLDIGLPDMDGYEVLQQLQLNTDSKSIPIIFVTGKNQQKDEEKGLRMGAVDYITKPIHPIIVTARVKTQISLKQQKDQLLSLAVHDQLTGLYNRHFLMDCLSRKTSFALRQETELSLIMLDIDHFKNINDNYGHPSGDSVLKSIAQLLQDCSRKEDITTRFGGEEFIILMDNCNQNIAQKKAQHLCKSIAQLKPDDIQVSCSFGVTQFNHTNDSIEDFIKRADIALYQAKEAGRNQVVVFS